ncbi:MAG: SxtJ family membrane protein, partial [Acidobacteriota bacterium]
RLVHQGVHDDHAIGEVDVIAVAVAAALLGGPHRGWLAFAHVLGRVNTAIFLFLTFFLVLAPLGIVLRLFGRDELRRRGPSPESMWTPYPERNRDPRHYEAIW